MKKSIYTLSIFAFALAALSSCGEKKINEPEHFEGIYYEEGTSDRAYFEAVGSKVASFIKPSDQEDAVRGLATFVHNCERCSFPENFYDRDEVDELSRSGAEVVEALESYDYISLSRAVTNFVYNITRFKGLYQVMPSSDTWQFIEKSENVKFRYWVNNIEFNLTVTAYGESWSETVDVDGYTYSIEIPKQLDLAILRGDAANASAILTSKVQTDGRDGDHLNVSTSTRLGNIQLDVTTKATQSKVTEDIILYQHDVLTAVRTTLVSSNVQLTGNNLCSLSAWRQASQSGNPLSSLISSGSGTLMVYNSLQVKSQLSNPREFFDNVGRSWSSADGKSQADKAAQAMQSAITAELRYCSDDQKKVRGTLGFESYLYDDYYDNGEWMVRPTVTFVSDGATFDIESYFGNGRFLSLENTYKNLCKSYRYYWR